MSNKGSYPQAVLDFEKIEDGIRRVERAKMNAKSYRPHLGSDICKHCGGPTKEWRHTLSAQLGKILCRIYRHGSPFMARDLALSYAQASNLQKIRYWGLIEHVNPEEERAGLWRLTVQGEQFVRSTIRLRKKVWTFRTEVIEFEGDEVLITDLCPDWKWRVQWAEEESRPHAA